MNCKPGDLAIVIGALHTPENIGRIVEVVRPTAHGDVFMSCNGRHATLGANGVWPAWRVRSDKPLYWRLRNGSLMEVMEVPMSDQFLRPVSGIPLDEETFDKVSA
jgi:hypothetical protein